MKKNICFIHVILLLVLFSIVFFEMPAVSSTLSDSQKSFEHGNDLYLQGRFQESIQEYQKLINLGYASDVLYYNLGLAFIKTTQLGFAVWAFEKALILNPFNAHAEENLANVRKEIPDSIEHQRLSFLQKYLWFFSHRSIFLFFIISESAFFFLLFIVIVFQKFHKRPLRQFSYTTLMIMLMIALFSGTCYFAQRHILSQEYHIVMNASSLKEGPVLTASNLFEIPIGTKIVHVEQENLHNKSSSFLFVKLPNGLLGWVETKNTHSLSEHL